MIYYASIKDIEAAWRPLTPQEKERVESLLPLVTGSLNFEAEKVGKNLPALVDENEALAEVAKSVTIDVVARTLMTSTDNEPMTQFSQAALGYSISGTYLVPGGGLFIKKSELARLGLRQPKYGAFEIYEVFNTRHRCAANK